MGLRVDFAKGECGTRLSGLITENGLLVMLGASEFQAIDRFGPFLGALVDLRCGNDDAQVIRMYKKYGNVVNFTLKILNNPGWIEKGL